MKPNVSIEESVNFSRKGIRVRNDCFESCALSEQMNKTEGRRAEKNRCFDYIRSDDVTSSTFVSELRVIAFWQNQRKRSKQANQCHVPQILFFACFFGAETKNIQHIFKYASEQLTRSVDVRTKRADMVARLTIFSEHIKNRMRDESPPLNSAHVCSGKQQTYYSPKSFYRLWSGVCVMCECEC